MSIIKRGFKAVLDSWVTSIMGIIIYVITTVMIIDKSFDFLWEGIGGYLIGTTLLLFPRSIERFISAWLKEKDSDPTSTDDVKGESPTKSNE